MRHNISKIMKVSTALFFLILVFTTVAMAAEAVSAVAQAMDTAGFTEVQAEKVENVIASARGKGIPNDVMVDKLLEGIAKQVAPEKITQAIERIASRHNYAHSLAKQLVKDEKKVAQLGNIITSGITAGLTPQHAERLIAELKSKQKPGMENYPLAQETMLVARDLSRRGVASATTAAVVEKALQKGLGVNEMRAMRGTFNQQHSSESLTKGYLSAGSQGYGMANEIGSNSGIGGVGEPGGSSGTGGESGAGSGSGGSGSGHR